MILNYIIWGVVILFVAWFIHRHGWGYMKNLVLAFIEWLKGLFGRDDEPDATA